MDERRIKRMFHGLRHTLLHPQWLVFRRDSKIRRWLAGYAQGRVLDIGCADGGMRNFLSADCDYVGLDYPGTALEWYGTRPQVFGDAADLPFSHESFDTVMLLDVLEHLPEPAAALGEIHRVLRPGGRLILKVPGLYPLHDAPLDFHRWTEFGVARDLNRAGFELVASRCLGSPLETAMLLANLAHAKQALGGLRQGSVLAVLLALLLPVMVPLRNLCGWLSAGGSRDLQTMPYALGAIARRY